MILISVIDANSCLSKYERSQIGVSGVVDDFDYIPNYIQCNKDKNKLEEFVCKDEDYLLMFHYLSESNIYAWENVYKHEVNHKTWNKKSMSKWTKNYNVKEINSNHLCFDLKKETINNLGGEAPYKIIDLFGKKYFFIENKHGGILKSREGDKFYLGKSCDVLTDKKQHAYWFNKNGKYHIEVDNKTTEFFDDELFSIEYHCTKKYIEILKLKKILKKYPNRTVAHYNLADAYWALGEKKKAIASYTTYIEQMCNAGKEKRIPQVVRDRVSNK